MTADGRFASSPLDGVHRELGARMVPFGGWEMPLNYPAGTLAEHGVCRTSTALFDVSHLGSLRLSGPGAFDLLQATFTNDLGRIGPGRAQYTHLLDEVDASILDDVIVWWLDGDGPEGDFVVLPNAANDAVVLDVLPGCVDLRPDRALLAVQGPTAREVLAEVSSEAAAVGRFVVASVQWSGVSLVVAGTGYTGEDGVEVSVPADRAGDLWSALLAAGAMPAGLGARDTLRLEAGLPLHGRELGPGITPLEAGLGWVVGWDKGPFLGSRALAAQRESGPEVRLRGLAVNGRRPPRQGQAILRGGESVATVTSGNFSPTLGHGIALAHLPVSVADGEVLILDQRGTEVPATVVPLPFVGR
ncbi:MAG: glycine cleavage system aminomethyltransferase GcvT [Actinomycetota bacterium]|nr:glycine cleavage system aminomethyltransferase GcvT [Actinomycetota bacterium]